jgi:hypothetical protein
VSREALGVVVRTSLAFCFPFSLARAPLFPFALRPRAVRPPSSNESEPEPELIRDHPSGGRWGWDGNPAREATICSGTTSVLWYINIYPIVGFKQVRPNTPDPQHSPLKLSQHLLYCISQYWITEPFHNQHFCS